MKIIFVRHGEPLKDDYGIADMGKKEMKLLADYLEDNYHINSIFSATSQRATESVAILNEKLEKEVTYYDWLSEFKYKLSYLPVQGSFPWELPPEYWINDDTSLHYSESLMSDILVHSTIPEKVQKVWEELDKVIAANGYEREGNIYRAISPNRKQLVVVTHFATMAVMLAHLLNISVFIAWNMLFMAPSSYTVLATEEIVKGKVIFRCLEL